MSPQDFAALPDVSEGLEHRLYQAARQAGSLEELLGGIKSKRYPTARARRLVLSAFLGLGSGPLPPLPPYLRVLGMTPTGQEILKGATPCPAPGDTPLGTSKSWGARPSPCLNWRPRPTTSTP